MISSVASDLYNGSFLLNGSPYSSCCSIPISSASLLNVFICERVVFLVVVQAASIFDSTIFFLGVVAFTGSITGASLRSRDTCAVSGFVFVLRAFTHGNTPAAVCIAASLIALVKSSYSPFLYDS